MGKITKTFSITYRKTFADQVQEMQTTTKKAFKEIEDTLNAKSGAAKRELPFKISRSTNDYIKSIDVPDGFELELHQGLAAMLRIKKTHAAVDANDVAWIVCDIVGETRIGEGCHAPLECNTHSHYNITNHTEGVHASKDTIVFNNRNQDAHKSKNNANL